MRLANGACELLLRKRERVGNFMGALLYQTLRESIVDAIRSKYGIDSVKRASFLRKDAIVDHAASKKKHLN